MNEKSSLTLIETKNLVFKQKEKKNTYVFKLWTYVPRHVRITCYLNSMCFLPTFLIALLK
jgi:hypothetical protein